MVEPLSLSSRVFTAKYWLSEYVGIYGYRDIHIYDAD